MLYILCITAPLSTGNQLFFTRDSREIAAHINVY